MNYALWKDYFEFIFAEPKGFSDLRQVGLIPSLEDLTDVDACFISHAHGDHWRFISALPEGTPVYLGECTLKLVKAWVETRRRRKGVDSYGHLSFKTFHSGDRMRVGGLEVEAYSVDHSVPGAYGFIFNTSSGPIVYTGDFRLHGTYKPEVSVLDITVDCGVRALICEGTNVGQVVSPTSERDVEERVTALLQRCECLAIADMSPADVDRIKTFYKASLSAGRRLVATERIATVLQKLSDDTRLKPPRVGDEVLEYSCVEDEIRKHPSGFILCTSFYSDREVRELKPPPGSVYILSCSEPFEEERVIAFQRLQNWLHLCGAPTYHIHSSGHVYPIDLRAFVSSLKPKEVFPMHTAFPNALKVFIEDLTPVTVPKRAETYILT